MRYIILIVYEAFLFFIFLSSTASAQINYGWAGLYPIDSCSFETPNPRLVIDTANINNNWQIGSTNKLFFGQSLSLPNAIMTDTVNHYSSNNLSYFDLHFSSHWDYTGFPYNMYIKFDHKYETDSLIDGGYITVSHDSGQTFQNILYDSTCIACYNNPLINSVNMYALNDTLLNGESGFTGNSDWKTTIVQWIWMIPAKNMVSDSLIVRFNFVSDGTQTNKDGWIIDNIEIGDIFLGGSVEEFKNIIEASIYPNIASNYFNYEVKNDLLNRITISNMLGEVVFSLSNPKSYGQVDISQLSPGNYFVMFNANNKFVVKRLVVN